MAVTANRDQVRFIVGPHRVMSDGVKMMGMQIARAIAEDTLKSVSLVDAKRRVHRPRADKLPLRAYTTTPQMRLGPALHARLAGHAARKDIGVTSPLVPRRLRVGIAPKGSRVCAGYLVPLE